MCTPLFHSRIPHCAHSSEDTPSLSSEHNLLVQWSLINIHHILGWHPSACLQEGRGVNSWDEKGPPCGVSIVWVLNCVNGRCQPWKSVKRAGGGHVREWRGHKTKWLLPWQGGEGSRKDSLGRRVGMTLPGWLMGIFVWSPTYLPRRRGIHGEISIYFHKT